MIRKKSICGYSSYKEYINSPEWKDKREWIIEVKNSECELCKKKEKKIIKLIKIIEKDGRIWFNEVIQNIISLHVHHLNYDTLGNEGQEDVQVLCRECHEKIHYGNKTL